MPLEPEALEAREWWGAGVASGGTLDASVTNAGSLLSIAISLKRIADALDPPDKEINGTLFQRADNWFHHWLAVWRQNR